MGKVKAKKSGFVSKTFKSILQKKIMKKRKKGLDNRKRLASSSSSTADRTPLISSPASRPPGHLHLNQEPHQMTNGHSKKILRPKDLVRIRSGLVVSVKKVLGKFGKKRNTQPTPASQQKAGPDSKPNRSVDVDVSAAGSDLPIYEAKTKLIQRIRHSEVLIVLGETGSGKTTQIPKYIYEAGIMNVGQPLLIKKKGQQRVLPKRMIAITQPRRVAAVSIAKRVASELGDDVGNLVGYSVRFENVTTKKTVIKYMTDGMLLRESIQDPLFNRYSFIVVDEAHERTVNTDLILGLVKKAQEERAKFKNKKKHLKLIIMSATIDTERLVHYFPNANVVYVQGRYHKVRVFQPTQAQDDYCFSILSMIINLHQKLPLDHHFLAFLTGQDEIDSVTKYLKELQFPDDRPLRAYPLSASISYEAQLRAVGPVEDGCRKVVVSTNIAETSLTIPGIRVVIDCGFVKAKFHINGVGLDVMKIIPISQSQVWQRSGRAGRETDGSCYRLYTGTQFGAMPMFQEPEIRRVNLSGVLLYLYKLGFENPEEFDWIDPPDKTSLAISTEELVSLGAIDLSQPPSQQLTALGSRMVEAPLSPAFSKILITSAEPLYAVQEPVCTILAMLASDSIFLSSDPETQEKRRVFFTPYGDLIMNLKIYRQFTKSKDKKEWCKNYQLNFRALKFVKSVRQQLLDFCKMSGLESKTALSPEEVHQNVIRCFMHCMPQNLAYHVSGNKYNVRKSNYETIAVSIHPSSSMHNRNSVVTTFTELVQIPSGNNYIKHVSFVSKAWVDQQNKSRR